MMAKDRRRSRSGVTRVLEQKKSSAQPEDNTLSARAFAKPAAEEPTGSCRYADAFGQMQCESPVAKSYCDGKGGFFTEDTRC